MKKNRYKLIRTWVKTDETEGWSYGIQINDRRFEDLHANKERVYKLMTLFKRYNVSEEEFAADLKDYVDSLYDPQ